MAGHATIRAQLPAATPFTPGQDALSKIIAGMRTWYWRVTLRANVTLAGGPSVVINAGRLAALFQFVGISESGVKTIQWDGRAMALLSDLLYAGMPNQMHLVTGANGTYDLMDQFVIPCAWPLSPRPWETAFVEVNPNLTTNVFLTPWASTGTTGVTDGVGTLVAAGGGTLVINSITAQIEQVFDANIAQKPLYRPRLEYAQTSPITGTINDFQYPFQYARLLRYVDFQQIAGQTEVSDILTGHQIRTDPTLIDGYNGDLLTVDEIQDQPRTWGGALSVDTIATAILAGAVPASYVNAAHLPRLWQTHGRLSQCLDLRPGVPSFAGNNFRIFMTGNVSATVVGPSMIYAHFYGLERIPGITADVLPKGLY